MTGVLVVLSILVGLPLLAWWLGSRRAWSRIDARGRDQVQAERDWVARHRLTPDEVARVGQAVGWGRRLDDPRLRAAAVERARTVQDASDAWQRHRPRWAAAVRWLSAAWLLLLAAAVVFAVAFGEWPGVLTLYLLWSGASLAAGWVQRRNLRRAVERNRDQATRDDAR